MSFSEELRSGLITEQQLAERPELLGVFGPRRPPPATVRLAERLAVRSGALTFENGFLSRVRRVREQFLGARAEAPPRFLIRVDEFPDSTALDNSPRRWREATKAFHETLASAEIPYLMAIVPQYTHAPLDPRQTGSRPLDDQDAELIIQMAGEGVTFAQHGETHRTRSPEPQRRTELCGLDEERTEALIDAGWNKLAAVGVSPRVFVPPFNRFDISQFSQLARRFDVICGGPENVRLMGFHGGPLWRGDAVYLPCYPPYYASAGDLGRADARLVEQAPGVWIPITLHVSWEIEDGFRSLAAFARRIAPFASAWSHFLDAVDASQGSTAQ